ncbi:MAG: nucleotidyltransferase family protein [Chloroflexota bacterium]|nr:nucleotidyltransferase family protein [Chloroflexota bacterium]
MPAGGLAAGESLAVRNRRLLDEGVSIVERARAEGVEARLLGGLGILQHDAALQARGGSRAINDIDLIVPSGQHRFITGVLVAAGYAPEERFNALNGHRRMVFHAAEWDLDVLVGVFEMCHRIDMSQRIGLDFPTLPVTDLLLTKLQIVKLNAKDAGDIVDLLAGHALGEGPGDQVDLAYMRELVRDDWGLWRTATGTIETVIATEPPPAVAERLGQLLAALRDAPKSTRWKLRARVGDRVAWYVLPDEVKQ